MTLPSHLVVRLGRKALANKSRYKVNLKIPLGHIFEHILETADDFAEMQYNNDGPSDIQWGDIEGTAILIHDDESLEYTCGYGVMNPWLGYPQAVIGYTDGFNPNVDGYDYHKFSENETYSWTLEYTDGINPDKWYRTYRIRRLSDTSSKEFVLWLDD